MAVRHCGAYGRWMVRGNVGPLVRQWRAHRARSQLDLAHQVGVSPRHLSFVETGKSRPSPELIEAIGIHLDIPLRERNAMLLAAGYAPRYGRTPLDDAALADYLTSRLDRLIALTNDRELQAIRAEVLAYPGVRPALPRGGAAPPAPARDLLVPFQLRVGEQVVSMFTTLTSFGTPRDITLDELAVELFFPADAAAAEWFATTSSG